MLKFELKWMYWGKNLVLHAFSLTLDISGEHALYLTLSLKAFAPCLTVFETILSFMLLPLLAAFHFMFPKIDVRTYSFTVSI